MLSTQTNWYVNLKNVTYSLNNEGLPNIERIPAPLESVDEILLNLQEVEKQFIQVRILFNSAIVCNVVL